jgi:hypothetical protein
MRGYFWMRALMTGTLFCAGSAFAAGPAAGPLTAAFGQVEQGQWQLRETGSAAAPRLICVTDPDRLIQLEHASLSCTRLIVDDRPRTATVSYACPGAGHGRTMIRIETRNSFHLETQGISGGAPFDMAFEARRMGACATASGPASR